MRSPLVRARRRLGLALLTLLLVGCARPASAPGLRAHLSSSPVATSTPPPAATPAPPTPTPATIADLPAADAYLAEQTASGRFSGAVLVAREGRILLEKGYGLADRERAVPNTPQTRFHIASLTKQFTAMAILQLQERGKLRVTDRISRYLPGCPSAWRDITIEHLLTHTSGLVDYFNLDAVRGLLARPVTPAEIVALFRDQPLQCEAGSNYCYSNSGYVLLGQIVERASGQSYATWIGSNILSPLGMAHTTYGPPAPPLACAVGYETAWTRAPDADLSLGYSAGGLSSTVEDLYLWDQALYTTRLCSRASLDAMFTSHAMAGEKVGCGYGWFIRDVSGRRRISHTGLLYGHSAIIARFPDERVTIIMLSNLEDAPLVEHVNVLTKQILP